MENVKWIEAIWNADKADPSGKRGFIRIFLSALVVKNNGKLMMENVICKIDRRWKKY